MLRTTANTKDYVGSIVYENDELSYTDWKFNIVQFHCTIFIFHRHNTFFYRTISYSFGYYILMPEGRFVRTQAGTYAPEYYLKDHLGDTRSILSAAGTILEQDAYYPFGMAIESLSYTSTEPQNLYLYNSKELQPSYGLEWLEYGARMYDAVVARWWAVDPLAEKYYSLTPYNYVANNPLVFVDPNGSTIIPVDPTSAYNAQVYFTTMFQGADNVAALFTYDSENNKFSSIDMNALNNALSEYNNEDLSYIATMMAEVINDENYNVFVAINNPEEAIGTNDLNPLFQNSEYGKNFDEFFFTAPDAGLPGVQRDGLGTNSIVRMSNRDITTNGVFENSNGGNLGVVTTNPTVQFLHEVVEAYFPDKYSKISSKRDISYYAPVQAENAYYRMKGEDKIRVNHYIDLDKQRAIRKDCY